MRILMLGWEYPPHISGGLGTACEGLTTALASRGIVAQLTTEVLVYDAATTRGGSGGPVWRYNAESDTPLK